MLRYLNTLARRRRSILALDLTDGRRLGQRWKEDGKCVLCDSGAGGSVVYVLGDGRRIEVERER